MTPAIPSTITDIHVHIQPWNQLLPSVRSVMTQRFTPRQYQQILRFIDEPTTLLEFMDRERIERVALVNYPSPKAMGFTHATNDFVLGYCRTDPDRLLAIGSLDPHDCPEPMDRIQRLIDRGLRMVKIHPVHQGVYPNAYLQGNRVLESIYATCQDRHIPVMVHTGTSIFPGARSKFGDPIYVEDIAIDFPRLRIVLAHGGRPLWMSTAFFLLRRFKTLYLDISGIPPKRLLNYFPRLEQIASRVVFGSDWPSPGVPGIRTNAEALWNLPLDPSVKTAILSTNARTLFKP